jgi:hypothetical protein
MGAGRGPAPDGELPLLLKESFENLSREDERRAAANIHCGEPEEHVQGNFAARVTPNRSHLHTRIIAESPLEGNRNQQKKTQWARSNK